MKKSAACRVLIVDDEPLAREGVRMLLESDPEIAIIGECADGAEASVAIAEQTPDLVFLDVQMPEMGGFDALDQIASEQMPSVIFVTAYDKYALQAFEVHALDYLLKPFTNERFFKALGRAKFQIRASGNFRRKVAALLEYIKTEDAYLKRVVIKSAGRITFLNVEEIDWIEAADTYVRVHVGRDFHILRGTMNRLEAKLDPDKFLRVQRSAIINIKRIKELSPLFHGEYMITLASGKQLTSGRSYRDKLQPFLENAF
jgi:two-component system LytT family response regulator